MRHPKPAIAPGLCYGRLDMPLDPAGLAQLPGLLAALAGFTPACVLTSPAARCHVVADAVAAQCGSPVAPEPALQELDFGEWEGMPWSAVARDELDRWAAAPLAFRPPGGESGAELVVRVSGVCAKLLATGRDAVVVSHGGPLRVLAALLQGTPVDLLAPAPALGSVRLLSVAQSA